MSKLVRDKIPQIIIAKGDKPRTRIASYDEYVVALIEKLKEEALEFAESGNPDELADVLEVLDAIFATRDYDKSDVIKRQRKKARERGKFKKRIILE